MQTTGTLNVAAGEGPFPVAALLHGCVERAQTHGAHPTAPTTPTPLYALVTATAPVSRPAWYANQKRNAKPTSRTSRAPFFLWAQPLRGDKKSGRRHCC